MTIFFLALQSRVLAWQDVTLAWNPSPDEDVVGYNVYFGVADAGFSQVVPLDNVLETSINGLAAGATYHFAVSAIDVDGNESPLSEEVTFTVPQPAPVELTTQIYLDESEQPYAMTIEGNTSQDGWWGIESSLDLREWQPYVYGYGADVFALAWLHYEAEPQKFFRLITY